MAQRIPEDEPNWSVGAGPKRLSLSERFGRMTAASPVARHARVRAKQAVRKRVPTGARASFRADFGAMLLSGLYAGAVFPFILLIARDDLKASPNVLAMMIAAPFVGSLLAMFCARAVEGRPKTPFVVWSWLAARCIVVLSFFAAGAWPFALAVSLPQLIGSLATPAYAAVIKDVYPDDQRGQILSYTKSTTIAAQVLTTLLAGWLMGPQLHLSYRVIFPVAAVIGILGAMMFSRINPGEAEAFRDQPARPEPLGEMLRSTGQFVRETFAILGEDRAFRWFALSVFTYGFGNLMTVPIATLIQVDDLHIHKSDLAVMVNLTQVAAIVSYFYWGRYVDRRSPQRAVVLNVLMNALVPLVYVSTALFHRPSPWILLPAFAIMGIVNAGIDMSYFNAILTFAGPENVSRYQALQSFLLGIRGTIAPFVGSALVAFLRDRHLNLRWALAGAMVLMVAGAWMQAMAIRRQEARQLVLDRG